MTRWDARFNTLREPETAVGRRRAIVLLLVSVAFIAGSALGHWDQKARPNWQCAAEDEVVIIGDQCIHVDALALP